MAINNFIPTIWSEHLYTSMKRKRVAVEHCNRIYEGDILGKGSVVKICGLGHVAIHDYSKNTNILEPQTLSDNARNLEINNAYYFNFLIDDIDRTQAAPHLMELAINNAAASLANMAEIVVFDQYSQAHYCLSHEMPSSEDVFNYILDARTLLMEQNVDNPNDIVIELSPKAANLLYKAKLATISDNASMMETGCIGNVGGSKVYISSQISSDVDGTYHTHHCIVRSKRAIAFAEQLSEIEAYRPELRFADAVKGLYLFGCKTIYPNEIVSLDFTFEE